MGPDNLFDPYEIPEDERAPAEPASLFDALEGESTRWYQDHGDDVSFVGTSDAEQEFLAEAPEGDYLRRRDEINQARRREELERNGRAFPYFEKFETEAERVKAHNNRAKDRGNVGNLTEKQWFQLRRAFGRCCAYCGVGCKQVVEHVRPIAFGGTTSVENVLPSCFECNRRKGLLPLVQWQLRPEWWREFRARLAVARKKFKAIPDHGRPPGSP
jgi:5-methylcytosine-specific restriction endonuclease McrA